MFSNRFLCLFLILGFFFDSNTLLKEQREKEEKRRNEKNDGFKLSFMSSLGSALAWLLVFEIFKYLNNSENKDKNKVEDFEKNTVTLDEIGGMEKEKEILRDVLHVMKNPDEYKGLDAPRGMVLYGPPGNGKTLIARALANEANLPFFYMSGSEFIEMYVGLGASRVREIFSKARAAGPAIIFIDEIDAIGNRDSLSNEDKRTINQLLIEIDGFKNDQEKPIFVIAATNRLDDIDEALLRSGRLEIKIKIDNPDLNERILVLKALLKNKNIEIEDGFKVEDLAKVTDGFSRADLNKLINNIALKAIKNGNKRVYASLEKDDENRNNSAKKEEGKLYLSRNEIFSVFSNKKEAIN